MMYVNWELIVTDIFYGFFFLVTLSFGVAVYIKSARQPLHLTFLLMSCAISIFQISHVAGVNALDPLVSRDILMGDLSVFLIVCFTVHWIFLAINKSKEHAIVVKIFYVLSALGTIFFLIFPRLFLVTSVPKLYFPNYYQAGPLYWILPTYFFIAVIVMLAGLFRAYFSADPANKRSIKYYIVTVIVGFILGSDAFFLVMNIPIDPIYSIFFNLYTLPLGLGIMRYDMMEIKVVAKKALVYGLSVAGVGLLIAGIQSAGSTLQGMYPWLPVWAIPLFSGLVSVAVGGMIWEKTREIDVLKYEFVNVVTHKFRTPLTRIKWSSEILAGTLPKDNLEGEKALEEVNNATETLVELTSMLIELREADAAHYMYSTEVLDMSKLIEKVMDGMAAHIRDKGIRFSVSYPKTPVLVSVDPRRIRFAIETIVENAIMYTPGTGSASLSLYKDGKDAVIQVSDTGMGISKEDMERIFNKFFRSKQAKTTDTEGMGIGLFMAKQAIERHGGSIRVESPGLEQGATFTVRLPVSSLEAHS